MSPAPVTLDRLNHVCSRLRSSVRELIGYQPGFKPQRVSSRFKVDKDFSSRLVTSCSQDDALTFAYSSPSAAKLRRLLAIAQEHDDVPAHAVQTAAKAVEEFERFIQAEFGDQSSMKLAIASIHPDLLTKSEATRKQAAFRGISQLKGFFAEIDLSVSILTATDDPEAVDHIASGANLGLRRLWPGAPLRLDARAVGAKAGERELISTNWPKDLDLPEHTLRGAWISPRLEPNEENQQVRIDTDILGPQRAVSFGHISLARNVRRVDAPVDSPRKRGAGVAISIPSKLLLFDLLVERDLFHGRAPELIIHDTAVRGVARIDDPSRDIDRLVLHEQVETLKDTIDAHRSVDVPFVPELIQFMLRAIGRDLSEFCSYRVHQVYPVYGSQVALAFDTTAP